MSRPLTIAIAGDVMLGRMVDETIAERGVSYPWGDLNRATGWERAWFERRLMALSAELGTTLAPTAEGLSATVRSKVGEVRWA